MKKIKTEWCENFIKARFRKLPDGITGVETNLFFRLANEAGLYVFGTYGSPMSHALNDLTAVRTVKDDNGNYIYSVFCLK